MIGTEPGYKIDRSETGVKFCKFRTSKVFEVFSVKLSRVMGAWLEVPSKRRLNQKGERFKAEENLSKVDFLN